MRYPAKALDKMWEAITMIEAQDQLKTLTALDWPNMKKAQKTKYHKELHTQAFPQFTRSKKYITPKDLQRVLAK